MHGFQWRVLGLLLDRILLHEQFIGDILVNKLFLDDIREPLDDTWYIVRSYNEFVSYIETKGIPYWMSLDHDLGEEKTGNDCLKYLLKYIKKRIDNQEEVPEQIFYSIHSQNPVGAKNMHHTMEYINTWLEL